MHGCRTSNWDACPACAPEPWDATSWLRAANATPDQVIARASLLIAANDAYMHVLPWVDFDGDFQQQETLSENYIPKPDWLSDDQWSWLPRFKPRVLARERGMVEMALRMTVGSGNELADCKVDRFKAKRALERGKIDLRSNSLLFCQLWTQIGPGAVEGFKRCSTRDRAFRVVFKGEGGQDAGGLYRELLDDMP